MSLAPSSLNSPPASPFGVAHGVQNITRRDYAVLLLNSLGIHPNNENVKALIAWEAQEGGWNPGRAKYNPLNTGYKVKGQSSPINADGVQSYPDFETGLEATRATLSESRYAGIVSALRTGTAEQVSTAIFESPWCRNKDGQGCYKLNLTNTDKAGLFVLGSTKQGQSIPDQILTGPVGDAVASAAKALSPLEAVGSFILKLQDPTFLKRAGFVVGGSVLILVGILITVRPSNLPGPLGKVAKVGKALA